MLKYNDPEWQPPETELYKPLSDSSRENWKLQYDKASGELKEEAKADKKYILNPWTVLSVIPWDFSIAFYLI